MEKTLEQKYPCYYVICAGMSCGPLVIPHKESLSDESVINYVQDQMKNHIKGRVIIEWGANSNKKRTVFWRDKSGLPYCNHVNK